MKVGHLSVKQDGNPKEREREHRDWFDQQHDPCRGAGSMGGGLIWFLGGGAKPLWEGSQRRGDTTPSPLFFEGSNGGDGKARDPEYKTWDRSRLRLSAVGL